MLGIALAQPAAAQPPTCDAAPGTAGVDQYCESVPGGSGSSHGDRGGGGSRGDRGDRGSGSTAPRATENRIRGVPGGTAVLDSLPGGQASPSTGGSSESSGGNGGASSGRAGAQSESAPAPAEPGSSLSGATSAASSAWTGEMRVVLALLALTLVAALVLGARRRTPAA